MNIGLFPFMIMAIIYRNVPRKKANEMLLLGERLSADEAQEAGLINRVVTQGSLDAFVHEWATRLAAKAPVVDAPRARLDEQPDGLALLHCT